ncbi:class Ib ribonucleoside-diphosphate reductase assembly flavoprotein NrdI [Corynebacterium uberis]|uniref:class Ib ribonucleoside-diphosphate reductase assembly flavoprotein NrdI n=1 Tax=Corynebacterium TaxID=1716 RepID=UPI001D0A8F0F|nr:MULTISPECIES: class Ib ribonucleoside-diphosphate reductase assembly flavoprotein NrdI [Corynebacterium]MCZ9308728.1 class Ib ribonucleoside-diphosphate reductase assembly flavoprotein NrdI [Corynebacterium sp. c6VSa_13]UDL72741.1 class Ib ribonucleoside-diphosphate reductase assembly flavoprotein NrdI [Corynebacterium uberis]UDL76383.1 class Ib ribonucleoside-diphosphate reductase assembly flavoprotein NrdI [Corynebacterium uberis]UDL78595.1 class Ib ribonucleoside-diphosphate reductase ass
MTGETHTSSPPETWTPRFTLHPLPPDASHEIVYFSSVSENTKRFVQRLNRPATRIPLYPRRDGMIRVCRPFVLIVPTYGGGQRSRAVPPQVIAFLNDPNNRAHLRGVITGGNRNFGTDYCIAGPIIAAKCHVPELHRFELLGTSRDVSTTNSILDCLFGPHERTQP